MPEAGMEPAAALHRAVRSLVEGHFDSRSVEGAQANALESIAWSLIGLLGQKVEPAVALPPASDASAPPAADAWHEGEVFAPEPIVVGAGLQRIPPRDARRAQDAELTLTEVLERAGFVSKRR